MMILLSLLQSCKGEKDETHQISEASSLVKGFTNWKDATRVLVNMKATTEALKATNDG